RTFSDDRLKSGQLEPREKPAAGSGRLRSGCDISVFQRLTDKSSSCFFYSYESPSLLAKEEVNPFTPLSLATLLEQDPSLFKSCGRPGNSSKINHRDRKSDHAQLLGVEIQAVTGKPGV
ncbi:MAG: hypothetical protein ACXWP5_12605, partial [Bdellovibrionota bacterium]